jgi:uncharacterized protein YecE (DUF72 family)
MNKLMDERDPGGSPQARVRARQGQIRVGVGGWSYEPWRETFYPKGLPAARSLGHASQRLTTIEINATFYRYQKPTSFAKWREETPEGFVFSVKAPQFATYRKVLAEAAPSVERFVASGLAELRGKLGPLLWQFARTKHYEREDMEAFLKLLPREIGGAPAQHALEPRHKSFLDPHFVDLARRYRCAIVFSDSPEYPSCGDVTSNFVYARLMQAQASLPTGYPEPALDAWAKVARTFARGSEPKEFARVSQPQRSGGPRDVYVYFINGAKERAPAAAVALLSRLDDPLAE